MQLPTLNTLPQPLVRLPLSLKGQHITPRSQPLASSLTVCPVHAILPAPKHLQKTEQVNHKYHGQQANYYFEAIDMDGRDPDFAASLRSIGPVNPNPTYSNSSTFNHPSSTQTIFPQSSNPALLVVNSRQRLNKLVDEETESIGLAGHAGRQFLDALTIQQVLTMRDKQGMSQRQIEKFLGLKSGVVDRLGNNAVVSRIA